MDSRSSVAAIAVKDAVRDFYRVLCDSVRQPLCRCGIDRLHGRICTLNALAGLGYVAASERFENDDFWGLLKPTLPQT